MGKMKRGMVALAIASGLAVAVPAVPASAGDTGTTTGVWVCITYTYIVVANNRVPTVQSITISTTPIGCDVAIPLPI